MTDEEVRLARNAYMQRWNAANRDRVSAQRKARRAAMTPEQRAAESARKHATYVARAEEQNARMREKRASLSPEEKVALLVKEREAAKRRYAANPERQKEATRHWRSRQPDHVQGVRSEQHRRNQANGKAREWHLRKYGITLEDEQALYDQQGGCCAICGAALGPYGLNRHAHLDHDHATGIVRGILCRGCNLGLGNFMDEPTLLEIAITYLRA